MTAAQLGVSAEGLGAGDVPGGVWLEAGEVAGAGVWLGDGAWLDEERAGREGLGDRVGVGTADGVPAGA